MAEKILFCASTTSHIRNFHLPYIKVLRELGYEVWVAVNAQESIPFTNQVRAFPFAKSFFSLQNVIALFKLRSLLMKERFDMVSTHTALASAILRLAVLLMPKKLRPRIIYIAHGFLFQKKDGFKKWVYLLPELICAPITNTLMVMNQEDLELAKVHHLYKSNLLPVNGIGIDLSAFHLISEDSRKDHRQSLGFTESDYLFIYAAEFSKRKNHEMLIHAFVKAAADIPNAHLLLAGTGILLEKYKALVAKLKADRQIHFLGYVNEIRNLYPLCNAIVSSSKVEGLPFNVMEGMACGLQVLVSDIKGHRDLVNGNSEFLFRSERELQEKLVKYAESPQGFTDWSHILKKYKLEYVMPDILGQYVRMFPSASEPPSQTTF